MSLSSRYSLHPRQSSLGGSQPFSASQSQALQTRIQEKRNELENLIALRELSSNLASQMQQLEGKLATLADGTQAVAAVLANWHTVLGAISMASTRIPKPPSAETDDPFTTNPAEDEDDLAGFPRNDEGLPMPQTLVRIPVNQGQAEEQEQQQR